jgi:hypothetical protein
MSKTTIKADTSKQGNVLDTVIDQEEEIIKENNGISQSPNKVKNGKIGYRRVAKNGQIRYMNLFHQFPIN